MALHKALSYANERDQEFATLEHLLLALLDDKDAAAVMRACNVDMEKLKADITEYIETELGKVDAARFHHPAGMDVLDEGGPSRSAADATNSGAAVVLDEWTRAPDIGGQVGPALLGLKE